jgi:hypothetical protein
MNRKLEFIKKIFIILILHVILLGYLFVVPHEVFAADPTLITKLKGAFEKIEGYILKLATPVAAISIGVGALMKKFSFGDEEKIRTGRNLIRGSLFSYAVVLCTDMILSLINTLVG